MVFDDPERISHEDMSLIQQAIAGVDYAQYELKAAILQAAEHGASTRELAEITRVPMSTIRRWIRESGVASAPQDPGR